MTGPEHYHAAEQLLEAAGNGEQPERRSRRPPFARAILAICLNGGTVIVSRPLSVVFWAPSTTTRREVLVHVTVSDCRGNDPEVLASRLCCVLLVAAVALGVAAPSAAAAPDEKLGATLGALWQKVIETPTPQNLFSRWRRSLHDLGGVVAPFAPALGSPTLTCTVKPGTKIFVAAWTSECSTLELPPFFGKNEAELRVCARAVDAGITGTRCHPRQEARAG